MYGVSGLLARLLACLLRRISIREREIHMYRYVYTPNLGLQVAVSDREREQGHFSGSNQGAPWHSEGAPILARYARWGAAKGSLMWLPLEGFTYQRDARRNGTANTMTV